MYLKIFLVFAHVFRLDFPSHFQFNIVNFLKMGAASAHCSLAYGRKSADRTKPYFDVTFFVFLSSCFGNLEVGYAKTVNIF